MYVLFFMSMYVFMFGLIKSMNCQLNELDSFGKDNIHKMRTRQYSTNSLEITWLQNKKMAKYLLLYLKRSSHTKGFALGKTPCIVHNGAFSTLFNLPWGLASSISWVFCGVEILLPRMSYTIKLKLCSSSVTLGHNLGAKPFVCIGLNGNMQI